MIFWSSLFPLATASAGTVSSLWLPLLVSTSRFYTTTSNSKTNPFFVAAENLSPPRRLGAAAGSGTGAGHDDRDYNGNHPSPNQVQMERDEELLTQLLPINTVSGTTTSCPSTLVDFVTRDDIKCDTVASMEWFLTTKEGIESLQGLTTGLRLEQIRQPKGTRTIRSNFDHHALAVSSVVGDEDEDRPLNSNRSNKNKKSSSNKGSVPTVTPISPFGGTVSSKCSPYLKDPLIDCETIGSMLWFLTTDEGIASLQGMVEGMDAERIVQRHAIISIFKDFNMMMTSKESENRELGISFITTFNECDMDEITCNNSGKITKIELSK
jgi:hypothetical protein